ncbi:M48 family metalloprotease [Pseudanabaena sp. FACHB-2040]|uniref:M48 family metalloprotease n=1 Tax=Pseudanabaena sp. FACHB-2040 TaxID=2692859 RepID=UPI001689EBC0|nr:M48 family metalloprotease [Pseudanabaena sp. FACHB-2040]MBD2260756.1 M48 family metalloprotease [Pseudanabaena sp. FACHB-2040]
MLQRFWRSWRYRFLAIWVAIGIGLLSSIAASAEVDRFFSEDQIEAYQLTRLSLADEVILGQVIDAQIKQEGLAFYTGSSNLSDFVVGVGQRLAAACDGRAMPYTFQVLEDEGINAFATVGGFVYINLGLIRAAENEAELAFVLAHEIGHIVGRHGVHQLWQELTAQALAQSQSEKRQTIVDAGSRLRRLSRSLLDEYDADKLGFQCLDQAGYAQSGVVTILRKIIADERSAAELASLHPFLERRVEQLAHLLASVAHPEIGDGLNQLDYEAHIWPLIRSL